MANESESKNENPGRVRNNSGAAPEAVRNKGEELKKDDVSRSTEKGKARIAPEYRKALEDYYKALSK